MSGAPCQEMSAPAEPRPLPGWLQPETDEPDATPSAIEVVVQSEHGNGSRLKAAVIEVQANLKEQKKRATFALETSTTAVEEPVLSTPSTPSVSRRPSSSSQSLGRRSSKVSKTDVVAAATSHQEHHGEPTPLASIAAGAVCFVLYFFFSIVFSAVIFTELTSTTAFGIGDGVGIVMLGIGVGCLSFARGSGCKAIISGPDLIPIISVQECGRAIQTYIELEEPEAADKIIPTTLVAMLVGNVCVGGLFFLLGRMHKTSAAIGFVPASVIAGFLSCIGYKVVKLAVFISTTFHLKFSYVDRLWTRPAGVDGWLPMVLAMLIGAPLYVLKRKHIMRTDLLILTFILVPLVVFYIGVAIEGSSMQQLRDAGWFLTTTYGCGSGSGSGSGISGGSSDSGGDSGSSSYGDDSASGRRLADAVGPYCAFGRVDFWTPLEVAYGSGGHVAWEALPQCIGIWLMGACITALDSMLKLSSSENALKVDLDYNHEMQVGGAATLLSALLCGMPSYGQTKFNVINFSIVHSTKTALPTLTCGVLALLTTLAGVAGPIINGLPRFLLAGLLVYSGAGFLVENLFEGRKRMTRTSFCITWIIFVVNFLWEFFVKSELPDQAAPLLPGLLVVFLLGIVLAAFEFIAAFMQRVPPAEAIQGVELCSTALRPQAVELRLGAMAPWYAVLPLRGFVFFGSATIFYQKLKAALNAEAAKPRAARLRILLLDCEGLTGVDPTACNTLAKARRLILDEHKIELVWAGLNEALEAEFDRLGLLQGAHNFHKGDVALKYVEDELLRRGRRLAQHVIHSSPTLEAVHYRAALASVFSIATSSPDRISSARLLPHATRIVLAPGDVAFDQHASPDLGLYLLFVGEVELVERFGRTEAPRTIFPGAFFNHQRCVLRQPGGVEALGPAFPGLVGGSAGAPVSAVALTDAVLLRFSYDDFARLQRTEPPLALQLLLAVIRQAELQRPGRTRPIPSKDAVVVVAEDSALLLDTIKGGDEGRRDEGGDDVGGGDEGGGDEDGGAVRTRRRSWSFNLQKPGGEAAFRVELTSFQRARFGEIFDLIDADASGEIEISELEEYISSVGREIPAAALAKLLARSGADADGSGTLSRDEFFELVRLALVSDLPARFVAQVRAAHAAAAAAAGAAAGSAADGGSTGGEGDEGVVQRAAVPALMRTLGVSLPNDVSTDELLDVMDADGSGDVSVEELIVGCGMVRREQLELRRLGTAFAELQRHHRLDVGTRAGGATRLNHVDFAAVVSVLRNGGTNLSGLDDGAKTSGGAKNWSKLPNAAKASGAGGGGELSAPYLARVLGISSEEADDLVFLADLDRHTAHRQEEQLLKEAAATASGGASPTAGGDGGAAGSASASGDEAKIDLFEFYRLIVGWA